MATMHKGKSALQGLLVCGAALTALVVANVLTCGVPGLRRSKLDLTENHIYSLTPASREMVRTLPERVNIKAYLGNVPAAHAEKATYVEMLLEEYREAAEGKITFEKIDPWDDKALRDELRKEGIAELRLIDRKDDKREEVPMYFHVVISHLDKKEIWTPMQGFSLEGLEYDISLRIQRLGHGKKKIGVTSGFGEPAQAQALAAEGLPFLPGLKIGLGDLYEVTPINWSQEPGKIAEVDLLIVNGPTQKVSEAALYHLDQHVMQGKPALVLVRGMKWEQSGQNPQLPPEMQDPNQPFLGMPAEHGLGELLRAWGFEAGGDTIMDAKNTAYGMIPPGGRQGLARGFFPLAESLQAGKGQMLAGVQVVAMPFVSTLKLAGPIAAPNPDFQVYPLLRTLPTSFAREGIMPLTKEFKLAAGPNDKRGPHYVAFAVAGKFASFFAGKPVPPGATPTGAAPAGEDGTPAQPGATIDVAPAHTRLIVASGSAWVEDQTLMDVRAHGDAIYGNGFVAVHNVVDWLAEDTALIAARSKTAERPLEGLDKSEKTALTYGNVIGPPLSLASFGLVYWLWRLRRRRTRIVV